MNTAEQLIKWEPLENVSYKYYIKSMCYNSEGLTIILVNKNSTEKKELRVSFDGWIASCQITDETYMDQRIQSLFKKYGNDFFMTTTFFKITNSAYARYISESSGTISDYTPLIHFAFFTDELILEVLATYEPSFTRNDIS